MRQEKNSEVARYYDKWDNITSRFKTWTEPEYYERAEQNLKKEEEDKRSKELLVKRRLKLKALLDQEQEMYAKEMQALERPKSSKKHSVDVLEQVNSALSEQEKRKRSIEAKLYSRWRYGITRDDIILESKNEHQAMAKLNWLDRQVESQLEKEREKKEFEKLQMQRQTEMLREEELSVEKKKLAESEIKELRRILEFHILELKSRESDSQKVRDHNTKLSQMRTTLETERNNLKRAFQGISFKPFSIHNFNKLKMLLRVHCETIHEEIQKDILFLEKIKTLLISSDLYEREQSNFQLISFKFDRELEELKTDHEKITNMYDSEVKNIMMKQERIWKENASTRYRLLDSLIEELLSKTDLEVQCNAKEIVELTKIKESHLKAIENTSHKLKELNHQDNASVMSSSSSTDLNRSSNSNGITSTDSFGSQRSKSALSSIGDQLQSLRIEEHKDTNLPQFGRKKIAWC